MRHRFLALLAILFLAAGAHAARVRPVTGPATRSTVIRPTTRTTMPATRPLAKISPEAKAILDKMRDACAKVQSIEFTGLIRAEFDFGQKQTQQEEFTSAFLAPNRFRHDTKTGLLIGSTGEKAYVYGRQSNEYVLKDAPTFKDRAALRAWPSPIPDLLRLASPPVNVSSDPSLMLAMSKDALAELSEQATEITKVADVEIDGAAHPAVELAIAQPNVKVTLAVDPKTSLVRRATTDLKALMEKAGVPEVKSASIVVDYTKTSLDAPLKPEQFGWTPPAGARESTGPVASAGGHGDDDADHDHDHGPSLAGQPAPEFTLKDAAGNEVGPAKLKGSVVVFDFWATWCGPCRASMPELQTLSQDKGLAAAGLKLYTINLRETPQQVNTFLAKEKLTLPVLFDTDGAVAKQYGVRGIPTTVVIGRDGKVTKVFAGLQPGALKTAIEEAMKK